jgi:hypothetical protein
MRPSLVDASSTDSVFLRRLNAYESEFGNVYNACEDVIHKEIESLRGLLETLGDEAEVSPRDIHRIVKLFLKKRFGCVSKSTLALSPRTRELMVHMLFLTMYMLSQPIAKDPTSMAILYEFMLDTFLTDGWTWKQHETDVCPHGSIFFAFAVLLHSMEQKETETMYKPTLAILKERRRQHQFTESSAVLEFEMMDDSMSDVVLEKGRLLGGISLFAYGLEPLAPVALVFDLNRWMPPSTPSSVQENVHNDAAHHHHHLLQVAGYSFVSRFVAEYNLLDVSKSPQEWATVLALYGALLYKNPFLSAQVFEKVRNTTLCLYCLSFLYTRQ